MKNEIIRKITSLTLMTIMLAGGMTVAFPGFTPDAYAVNANLIVSAEKTGGYVDGAQIVEILVIDDNLDHPNASPDVTLGGAAVAMTATRDGNWYAYVADTKQVGLVDNGGDAGVTGIDFGTADGCTVSDSDSETVYCKNDTQNVPASTKTSSRTNADWPFIQTYPFSDNIEIQYSKAGGAQIETLSFDAAAGGLSLDRSDYPSGAQVHVTIDDHRLNIDPTRADIWTWDMGNDVKYYGVVNGAVNAVSNTQSAVDEAQGTVDEAQGTVDEAERTVTEAERTVDEAQRLLDTEEDNYDSAYIAMAAAYADAADAVATDGEQIYDEFDKYLLDNQSNTVLDDITADALIQSENARLFAGTANEVSLTAATAADPRFVADAVEVQYTHAVDAVDLIIADVATVEGLTLVDDQDQPITVVIVTESVDTRDTKSAAEAAKTAAGTTEDNRNAARGELTDAQGELTDARGELTDARGELTDAQGELTDAQIANNTAVGGAQNVKEMLEANEVCGDCSIGIDYNRKGTDPVVQTAGVENRSLPDVGEWFIVREIGGPNTAVFSGTNLSNESILTVVDNAPRDSSATITYDGDITGILVKHSKAIIEIQSPDDVWTSGLPIPITIVDGDVNKNSLDADDVVLTDPNSIIPTLVTGDPFTLGELGSSLVTWVVWNADTLGEIVKEEQSATVESFSERAILTFDSSFNLTAVNDATSTNVDSDAENLRAVDSIVIDFENGVGELQNSLINTNDTTFVGYNFLNYNVESLDADLISIQILVNGTSVYEIDTEDTQSGYISTLEDTTELFASDDTALLQLKLNFDGKLDVKSGTDYPIVVDFLSFGFENDGEASDERIANQIIRLELEETGDDTGSLEGTLEYTMINQLNINDKETYAGLITAGADVTFIVIEDLTSGDAPSVTYLDVDTTGTQRQVSAQEDAPSHSAVVSMDVDSFKTADTVTVTLKDLDLNTNSDLPDLYTVVTVDDDDNRDAVGSADIANGGTSVELSDGSHLGKLLEITFDDQRWMTQTDGPGTICTPKLNDNSGLGATGFSLAETTNDSGVFVGTFSIPAEFCREGSEEPESVTGLDIEVNYVDFRDASGETTEVGDSAGVKANTGSVSLDRTVYPVPFGTVLDFDDSSSTTPSEGNTKTRSLFPIHQSGMSSNTNDGKTSGLDPGEFLPQGDLVVYVTVTDPDFDVSASGKDSIAVDDPPVTVSVIRGSESVTVAKIGDASNPIDEVAPDAGVFESSVTIHYYDGPESSICPSISVGGNTPDPILNDFDADELNDNYCILQGDILQVEYNDPTDASGQPNTVTDSATFDLRNGVLQSDKSVYIIGSDMIMTLIEPDLDLDSNQNETYDLDLIKWSSSAATVTMGDADGQLGAFDPEPLSFRETGSNTGIFQVVVEIPQVLDGDSLQRGEEIDLEYTDWGPSGSDYVGDQDEDIRLTVFTSNFGATIDLDQKVYSWTDKVYITVVAPDHNFDDNLIDEIGETDEDPLRVATKGFDLDNYRLVETGFDTGIFTGEVILTGFEHDPTGDGAKIQPRTEGNGPTDGYLQTPSDGGISVSYEFSEDETVFTSSIIRWNIGDVQWLEASYPASTAGVLRVIDPDMNLNPEAVDNFDVNVASNTDASGITLTVTETNEATGIFEGTVSFTTTGGSSGHRLRVSEGDTVTADYADGTLPLPYTTNDSVSITSTTIIGTIVPPLERAPASNLRIVNTFGNSIDAVSVGQQVQVVADLSSGQDRDQDFAYLIQVQNGDGVTVSLSWIAGALTPGQSFSPSGSWTPTSVGTYTVTAFVWESINNPTALSPPLSIDISVN